METRETTGAELCPCGNERCESDMELQPCGNADWHHFVLARRIVTLLRVCSKCGVAYVTRKAINAEHSAQRELGDAPRPGDPGFKVGP